jgi:cyclomaltodextrinase / maltogenic alpha-amylase / neopullulanase
MSHWSRDAFVYHLYPLGWGGAPARNDFAGPSVPRLAALHGWLDHLQALGVDTLLIGPVFESAAHGYDTADLFTVDRRLGDNATLAALAADLRARGMRLLLDGVFNHVGRDFWAFRDVQARGEDSPYRNWFVGLRFDDRSPYGDPFTYEAWAGNFDLVKLNLANPAVRAHLFDAVAAWVRDFGIDGLRLDVADSLDPDFRRALAAFCKGIRPDFWLVGEVVHGDYRDWAFPGGLDSVTNYEAYKGLYSSLVDANYFEIAYALNRQSGPEGIYRDLALYNFADNHDVDRVASRLTTPAQIYPLYALLFAMPGTPSLYYGSEWGIAGRRTATSDAALRPALDLATAIALAPQPNLPAAIARLARQRRELSALRHGDYRPLHVSHQQLAFARATPAQTVIVALNAAPAPAPLALDLPDVPRNAQLVDQLNPGEVFPLVDGRVTLTIPPMWARLLTI